MLRRRLPWLVAFLTVACFSLPSSADAQIGGFIKKKVKDAVKGPPPEQKQAPQAAEAQSPFDEYVLEMTNENLDKLEKAVAAERTYADSVNAAYAKVPTPEQHQQCVLGTLRDPEMQKISANVSDAASMQKAQEQMMAYREKKCGKDPEQILEGKKAALRLGSEHAAQSVGIKPAALAIMKERVTPFCESGGQAKVKGATEGMYYVYSPTEVAAIQPRCVKLVALLAPPKPATQPAAGRKVR